MLSVAVTLLAAIAGNYSEEDCWQLHVHCKKVKIKVGDSCVFYESHNERPQSGPKFLV